MVWIEIYIGDTLWYNDVHPIFTAWKVSKYGVFSGPYSVWIQKNKDQKNSLFRHFTRSVSSTCSPNFFKLILIDKLHNFFFPNLLQPNVNFKVYVEDDVSSTKLSKKSPRSVSKKGHVSLYSTYQGVSQCVSFQLIPCPEFCR